jgi:hypothetical protein
MRQVERDPAASRTWLVERIPAAWRPWIALVLLAIVAYVVSIVVARALFPLGSANQDDSMYRYFADLLGDRHITLPLSDDAFRPWASAPSGDRIVMIYEPPWPAALAFADLVFGTKRAAMGLSAAAGVVLIALLGRELFGRWREGLVAALCLALTPIFVFQSGLMLAYNFQLALTLGVLLAAIKGVRRSSAPWLATAGFVWAFGFWARPYDGAILAAVLGPWLLFAGKPALVGIVRRAVAFGSGAVWPLAAFASYTTVTLGSPFHSHFSILGDGNRPGFGWRGISDGAETHFTFVDGLSGTGASLQWMVGWMFGGALAVPLVLWGGRLAWRRSRAATGVLVSLAAMVLVAYTAFWSPHAIVWNWDGIERFGPFYHLALVIPIALFTAAGAVELWQRRRLLGAAVFVALLVATGVGLAPKVRPNRSVTDAYEARSAALDALHIDRALVFLEGRIDYGWSSAAPFLQNSWALDGRYVVAQDSGPWNFDALDRFPDRTPVAFHAVYDPDKPLNARYVPVRLSVDRGSALQRTFEVTDTSGGHRVVAYARLDDGREYEQVLDASSTPGFRTTFEWRLAAHDEPRVAEVLLGEQGWIEFGVRFDNLDGTITEVVHKIDFGYRVRDDEVQLIRPGRAWQVNPESGMWGLDVTGALTDLTPAVG